MTMPFSVGSDEIPQATIDEQEDDKDSESNENSSLIDFMEDDTELPEFDGINLKNYCRPQDVAYLEEEVKNMMESVKRVHEAFSDDKKFEEVFKFRKEECGDRKEINSEHDLKLCIEEIEKMDTILKVKVNEEKKAKLSRIQAEEESRNILTSLAFSNTSGGMKFNLEEFIKLLNEVDSVENDSSAPCKAEPVNGGDDLKEEDKKEKATSQQQKINNLKFVERNIQLAKCGHGTLSLTDEEKSRIESLLADVETNFNAKTVERSEEARGIVPVENKSVNNQNEKTVYGIDDETKSILSQIDERLEMMAEVRKPIKCPSDKISDENEKGKKEEKEERTRLKKINQQLNCVNSISGEEIYPLTDEELENLIRESKEMLTEKSGSEEVQCPDITELVSSAKLLMPKFKYRFDEE